MLPRDARSAAAARKAPTAPRRESRSARGLLASLDGRAAVQASVLEAKHPPVRVGPYGAGRRLRRIQQLAIPRSREAAQVPRRTVFDDAATVHDQHAIERQRVLDVVRDVHERRIRPAAPRHRQQALAADALEAAERLVEDDEPRVRTAQAAAEADALSF